MSSGGFAEWSVALDQQLDLIRWIESSASIGYLQDGAREMGISFLSWKDTLTGMLTHAEPFYVGEYVCELLEQTAPSIPNWTYLPESIPVKDGFIWFKRPFKLPVFNHRNAHLLAFCWHQLSGSRDIGLCFILSSSQRAGGVPVFLARWRERESLNDFIARASEGVDRIEPFDAMVFQWRLFAATFSFISQEILTTTCESPLRGTRKRAEVAKFQPDPVVRVVRLRRKHNRPAGDHEPSDIVYSCQWIVRGHWRQQFYRSTDVHKPIWITPYVKGDPTKPLKTPKTNLFAVVR